MPTLHLACGTSNQLLTFLFSFTLADIPHARIWRVSFDQPARLVEAEIDVGHDVGTLASVAFWFFQHFVVARPTLFTPQAFGLENCLVAPGVGAALIKAPLL